MTSQMQQDQDMPTLTNNRPFYSIVIPCYNSRETIGTALDSIISQQMGYDEIQVILSDDCSTESYQDIVNQYTDKLFITQTKTDYNCCPGNTRQKGADQALGEWLIFMDHDDQLVKGALPKLKKEIEETGCDTVFLTKFVKKVNDKFFEMPQFAGWTHGKVFNLDNFWKKYNLHYIKDMTSHEDICISTQMEFIRLAYNLPLYKTDLITYIWVANPDSLSNRKYVAESKQRVFIDMFLVDYIESTAGIAYNFYKESGLNRDFTEKQIEKVLLYSYFYNEYGRHKTPQYLIKNCDHIRKYILILEEQFNITIEDIYKFFKIDSPEEYQLIFDVAKNQIETFLFEFSFREWLYWIRDKKYLKA